jgi:hypothetical protein
MAFIAYFDYLGFKDFIERNDIDYQIKIVNNIFRDIENALGKGKLIDTPRGFIADLSKIKVHCINFSDTVLFWTDNQSIESLTDLLEVAYGFNWGCTDFFFPVRGAIVLGEVFDYKFEHKSENGGTYGVNSIFGKGLVEAHLKAEKQNWAGTVIDNSIVTYLLQNNVNVESLLSPFAKKYKVPYHKGFDNDEREWVLNLVKSDVPLNDKAYKNISKNIVDNFSNHNKRIDSDEVQLKIKNTIEFLESYK